MKHFPTETDKNRLQFHLCKTIKTSQSKIDTRFRDKKLSTTFIAIQSVFMAFFTIIDTPVVSIQSIFH